MPAAAFEQLGRRATFVVGKGGVGKTTTAGALAVTLADAGTEVHLLSTDPAHSLTDLFGRSIGGEPLSGVCSQNLTVEELDAERVVEQRFGSLAPALQDLIERGTYLDAEDAESLLDAALPGLDELGAALRISALARGERRLIVDTAPTGHTLRLLDMPGVLRNWAAAFDAMADKADVVASALLRQSVRLDAEQQLAQLVEEADRFAAFVREAEFLVVTGPGAVVAAETDRLVRTLHDRELHVAGTIAAARPGSTADHYLPLAEAAAGCDALRSLWRPVPPPVRSNGGSSGEARALSQRTETHDDVPAALDREFVVFAGKGGVGKSTCAAALAVRLAREGPVRLFGADPAGSLEDVLPGDRPEGLEVLQVEADKELSRLQALYRQEVEDVFRAVGLDHAAGMDREVVESLWDLAPPGVDELMAVSRLAAEAPSTTRLVLDTAPTGHFLRLVAMPELALAWVHRILRILLKYRALGALDAPAEHLIRFAKRFRGLRDRLTDSSRTAIVAVTLDEPMVRAETHRLVDRLQELQLPLGAVVVNRSRGRTSDWDVPVFHAPEVDEPRGEQPLGSFFRSWRRSS